VQRRVFSKIQVLKETYKNVNMGETTLPYCAARAEPVRPPFVVGDKHRIHNPHQHMILRISKRQQEVNAGNVGLRSKRTIKKTYSPKYGGCLLHFHSPSYNDEGGHHRVCG
jgi:hypothetical protein